MIEEVRAMIEKIITIENTTIKEMVTINKTEETIEEIITKEVTLNITTTVSNQMIIKEIKNIINVINNMKKLSKKRRQT